MNKTVPISHWHNIFLKAAPFSFILHSSWTTLNKGWREKFKEDFTYGYNQFKRGGTINTKNLVEKAGYEWACDGKYLPKDNDD